VSARVPYAKSPVTFKPEWTLFFAANHFPSVPGATRRDGFWRRVKIIPFDHALDRSEMNLGLPALFATKEAPGVLAWVIEGAMKWWDQYGSEGINMPAPDSITVGTEEAKDEADPLTAFFDTLVFGDDEAVTKADLFQYYLGWADHAGIRMPMTAVKLSREMKQSLNLVDNEKWYKGKNHRCWVGVNIPVNMPGGSPE
jgi:phage/plasmid-associated DNA primase